MKRITIILTVLIAIIITTVLIVKANSIENKIKRHIEENSFIVQLYDDVSVRKIYIHDRTLIVEMNTNGKNRTESQITLHSVFESLQGMELPTHINTLELYSYTSEGLDCSLQVDRSMFEKINWAKVSVNDYVLPYGHLFKIIEFHYY